MTEKDSPTIKYIIYESAKKANLEILDITFLDAQRLKCDVSQFKKIGFSYWDFQTATVDCYYNDYTIEIKFFESYNPKIVLYVANISHVRSYDEDSIVSIDNPDR